MDTGRSTGTRLTGAGVDDGDANGSESWIPSGVGAPPRSERVIVTHRGEPGNSTPALLNDRFEILLQLGTSAYTSDFIGFDRAVHESVRVRILRAESVSNPSDRRRIGDLLFALFARNHESVVPLVDWGRATNSTSVEPVYFVITKAPEGPTLAQLIAERGPVPSHRADVLESAVRRLLADLASASFGEARAPRPAQMWIVKGGGVRVDPLELVLNSVFPDHMPQASAETVGRKPLPNRRRRLLRIVSTAAIVLLAWYALAPAKWGGRTTFTIVVGSSMQPTFQTGDLVILRRSDMYGVGDVVTYRVPEDPFRNLDVVHRIHRTAADGRFEMRGDNRQSSDPWYIDANDIRGKQVLLVPKGGWAIMFLHSPMGLAVTFGTMITLWFRRSPYLAQAVRRPLTDVATG